VKLLAVLVLAAALTACSGGNAPATPLASTSRTVPTVQNPLDVSRFPADACALITAQEATGLGLSVSEKDDMGGRTACEWRKDNGSPLEVLRVQVLKNYGLAKISAECKIGCNTWPVTEVAGYPALHANGQLESKYGMCRLYVGLTDSSSVLVTDGDIETMQKAATQGTASGPKCDRADQAAALVVRKLRESR
jgi:hypothetical protein